MRPKDADGMANYSVDPDQSTSLIRVFTVCSGLSVQKYRIITSIDQYGNTFANVINLSDTYRY